jgi:hypothetical protein
MKHVDVEKAVAAAVEVKPAPMTRKEKLLHWANRVRSYPGDLVLFSNVEHWGPDMFARWRPDAWRPNALSVASADPVLRAQGLAEDSSVGAVLRFFELSVEQAHTFSCDCGGTISNSAQADRIERLASTGG